MVVYWIMIFWLKQSDTWKLKQSDTCVNGGLLNDDILIKTKWLKQSDTCVNSGLLNDDILIKTKWLKPVKLKQSDTCVNSGLLKWYD